MLKEPRVKNVNIYRLDLYLVFLVEYFEVGCTRIFILALEHCSMVKTIELYNKNQKCHHLDLDS